MMPAIAKKIWSERSRTLLSFFTAFALLLAPLAIASAPAHAAKAAPAKISGTLVNSQSTPLAGATVMVDGANLTSAERATTKTSADGSFSLPQPGKNKKFRLRVSAYKGVPSGSAPLLETWIGSHAKQSWTVWGAPIGYRARTTDIASGTHTIQASAGFDLTVSGASAKDVSVVLQRGDGESVYSAPGNADGLKSGFIPGKYLLKVSSPQHLTQTKKVTLSQGEKAAVTVDLVQAPTLSGTVTVLGKPSKRRLDLTSDTGLTLRVRSDSTGRYSAELPELGTWTVTAETTTPVAGASRSVDVQAPDAAPRADLTVTRRPGAGTMSGNFTADGKKTRGYVSIFRKGELVDSVYTTNGKFRIKYVDPGNYRTVFVDEKSHRYYSGLVTVAKSQDRVLKPKKLKKKTVTVSGSAPAGAELEIKNNTGPTYYADSARGTYRVNHVVPGTFTVTVTARDQGDDFGQNVRFTDRTYKKVKIAKSRTLNVTDGGKGGVVSAVLRYAGTNELVGRTAPLITAACKADICMRLTTTAQNASKPKVTGLSSVPYRIEVFEGEMDYDVGPVVEVQEKSPFYLTAKATQVRAVKGKTTSIGNILVTVHGAP